MGTIGILMAAYEEKELTADEVKWCIEGLQNAGRHISQKHYQMLQEYMDYFIWQIVYGLSALSVFSVFAIKEGFLKIRRGKI